MIPIFLFFLFAPSAFAFPELATHGYVNCTTCHVSPSGGGTLTEYGRGLSKELLSLGGREGEEKFLYGLMKPPEWMLFGGDVRFLQTYLNTPQVKSGDFFLMQADLAMALRSTQWTVLGTLGLQGGPESLKDKNQAISRIHYLMYQPTETFSLRTGRFLPQFGINEPNHTIVTRQGIGFNQGAESYNLEGAYLGERADFFVTGIFGRPGDRDSKQEKGLAVSTSANFLEKIKVGISALRAQNDIRSRWLAGPWGIIGLAKEFFLLTEWDHQWADPAASGAASTKGFVSYNRLAFEPAQGLQVYGAHQISYLNTKSVASRTDSFGPGVDFFPRPHLEIRGEFLRERRMAKGNLYYDTAWLMLHYYF